MISTDLLIAYIPIGIFVTGIYRATPEGRDPGPGDMPTWVCVLGWPFLAIWFSWWFTFTALPGAVTWFCRWLLINERKPKPVLPPDEVQQVLLGELTKPTHKHGEKS